MTSNSQNYRNGLVATIMTVAALGAVLATAPHTVFAQTPGSTGNVSVGGKFLFTIRTDASGLTPAQRVAEVQQRLITIAQTPIHASEINVVSKGYDAAIYVKGQLLITVDQPMARDQHSTALGIANEWATRLRQTLPALTYATGTNPETKTAGSASLAP